MQSKSLRVAALAVTSVVLVSCGRPDNSGIFVASADRDVTLIQLVQTTDGHVTGRFEDVSIAAGGAVNDVVTTIEGAASEHELTLMFKPLSFVNAGFTATGKVSGDTLTLTARGMNVKAERATLESYQTDLQHLQANAAVEQKMAADAQAAEQARQAAARAAQEVRDQAALAQTAEDARLQAIADRDARLVAATSDLRRQTAALDAALAAVPDLGRQAEANTERVARMLQAAPTMSRSDRGQLSADANQVVIDTHQLEIDRNQHRIDANQYAVPAGTLADQIAKFCASPEALQHAQSCKAANPAISAFQASLGRGKALFVGLAQRIRDAEDRQRRMVSAIYRGE